MSQLGAPDAPQPPLSPEASSGAERVAPVRARVRRPSESRMQWGWMFLVGSLVLALFMSFLPSPYVIQRPGPVYDTLGTQEVDGKARPLINISGAPVYPTAGQLDMLTVSVVGSPDGTPSWAEIIGAFFDKSQAVVPLEAVFPPDVSSEDRDSQNQQLMLSSQTESIAAALIQLGYEVTAKVTVLGVADDSPARGALEPGDVVTGVNGTAVTSLDHLRELLSEHGTAAPATIEFIRDGETESAAITPYLNDDDAVVLGIGVGTDFEFPFDVTLAIDNVGGPSAGMMFALGIIDNLTEGELNGGQHVAGTGTITSAGVVGPIGGIRQKLFGAERAGAEYFLAPVDNCDEVVGNIPDGLTVIPVATLEEALATLEMIESGTIDSASIAGCDVKLANK